MYQIVYGLDTESIEDPTQIVLLDLPDDYSHMDSEELESKLNNEIDIRERNVYEAPTPFTYQLLLGLQDVIESFVLAMQGEGVPSDRINVIVDTVTDAIGNNNF